jgi:chromosomal replication initiation ATPase DnaA
VTQKHPHINNAMSTSLGAATGPTHKRHIGPADILHAAQVLADEYGYDADELMDSQAPAVSRLRQALYYACRELGCSYSAIGRVLGKDHSTVLVGARKFAAFVTSPEWAATLAHITTTITERLEQPQPKQPTVLIVTGMHNGQLVEARRWLAANAPNATVLTV